MSDAFTLYSEFANGGIEMSWGMNADGSYDESISNESARHVFVSLYHLAQDLRTFVESPMARNQRRLERLTLNDPAFQRMFTNFQILKMFAVANTSALRVSTKAPVTARRTVAPKAALVADLKKVAKKAAPAILTATTTMLPAAAALAEEEVTPIDLKLAIGFTVAIGIAAFSTLPEPESSKHGGEH